MEINELLEQIAIAESTLKEQIEDESKYDPDNVDHWEDVMEVRVDIQGTQRNLAYFSDRLKSEQGKIKDESP